MRRGNKMKKFILSISIPAAVVLLLSVVYSFMSPVNNDAVTQTKAPEEKIAAVQKVKDVIAAKKLYEKFDRVSVFEYQDVPFSKGDIMRDIKKYINLKINRAALTSLLTGRTENITFSIPVTKDSNLDIELTKFELLSDDFKVLTNDGKITKEYPYNRGIFYRGIVKGQQNSFASLSVFDNLIMGMISSDEGTFNLGPVDDNSGNSNYIFYNEKDCAAKNKFKCDIDGKDMHFYKTDENPGHKPQEDDFMGARLPVKIYIEADYKLYQDRGSSEPNVVNFVTGYYNSVAAIYQNEYIPVTISQISVWTTPDPYRFYDNSIDYLYAFGVAKKDNFNGDLAQFLTTRPLGAGGVAWIGTLCASYNPQDTSGRYSFCNIDNVYYSYPTYSWTVMVSTHELGHNFGSMHTHACWWPLTPNTIGAIDSCYYAEGNCFPNPGPSIGTIMSYCHLQEPYGGGIDPRLGFGPMPGDTVRLRYNQCSKFGPVINSSETPTSFSLMQNFPNPFNPVTTIRFAVPENTNVTLKIYDINGREVAQLLNNVNYGIGAFNILFNSGMYGLSSGVYFYRVTAVDPSTGSNKFTEVKRMILIK
jgi:hypothetical protein